MVRLIATFHIDRSQTGTIKAVSSDGAALGQWPCLGKSDNAKAIAMKNHNRDPLKQFGDTPCGTWKVSIGKKQEDESTYGCLPPFTLWPTDGDALLSHSPINRRSGIWIHSGDLTKSSGLRVTYGCIRVHESTMRELHALAKTYGGIESLETREE